MSRCYGLNYMNSNQFSVHPRSITFDQIAYSDVIFHMVVSVVRLAKIWNTLVPCAFQKWIILIIKWSAVVQYDRLFFFHEGTVTNPAIWLVLSAVRIFLSLNHGHGNGGKQRWWNCHAELVSRMNYRWSSILSVLHFHGRLINGSLSLFTFK